MRVLVLGGTGFIGQQIVRRLALFGHEISILHRDTSAANSPEGVSVVHGDRNQLERSGNDVRRIRPDVVIDCVAFTQQQAASLVEVFRGVAKRVVVQQRRCLSGQ